MTRHAGNPMGVVIYRLFVSCLFATTVAQAIDKFGAPERSRTPNPQIRSLVLYPIELRARAEKRASFKGGNNYSTGS